MPNFRVTSPEGKSYIVTAPEGATEKEILNYAQNNFDTETKVVAPATAAIPERTYGEVAKDVGAAVATGLGGLGQFPGQLYGLATGDFSDTGLYGKAKELEKYGESLKSPGLVAREKASQARIAEAEKEGQVSSFFTTIKEIITDPVQLPNFLISQSIQSIPSIAAALVPLVGPAASAEIKALQIAAKTATSVAAKEIAEKELKDYVADVAIKTGTKQAVRVGAVQQGADIGTGAYEDIYSKLISQDVPEDQAAEKALGLARAAGASGAAISLLAQNLPGARVLEERLAGMRFGSPGGVGGNIASRLVGGVGVGLKEGLTEIPEEVGGKFSQNLAMQQVDPTQALAEGLGATGGQAFIGGFGLGSVIGALTHGNSARIAEEKRNIDQAKLQTQKEQALEQQNLTKTQLGITEEQQQLGLPTPDELFKQTVNPLFNPFGNYSAADLGINPEVDAYVKQHRQLTGKPTIESYSIEDIQDAMPGTNTVAEKAAIDSFLTKKTGYTREVTYTPQDIQNVATQKNIETKTKGFDDFLTRTTGISDVAEMSQPQLHAAFTALAQLPKSPDLQILPQGTNATRFTDDQYKTSIESLKAVGNNLSREDALNKIYDQIKVPYAEPVDPIAVNKAPDAEAEQRNKTYFENLQRKNAESILSKALRQNDLETVKVPKFDVIAPDGSVTVSPLTRESAERIAKNTEGFTVKESSVEKIAVVDQSVLPKGFDIQQQSFKQDGVPAGYQIKAGNVLISPTAFTTEEEATNKVKNYEAVRTNQIKAIDTQLTKLETEKTTGQNKLDAMEVSGSSSTPAYRVASAAFDNQVRGIDTKVVGLNKQKELLAVPLQIIPTGSAIRSGFTVFEQGIPKATLPTKQAAEEHIIANASDETLQNISTSPTPNRLRSKANEEINRRAGKVEPGIRVARSPELEEQAVVENQAQMAKLEETLKPMLAKFGLNTTKLKVVKEIDGGKAEASYAGIQNLINIAFDAVNPVRALRHESVHALKKLGFFTDGQWKALVNQANTKWVNKYLKQKNVSGNPLAAGEQSRYDAYMKAYAGDQEAIIEEAISDAFADFDINGAPAGFMAALLTKIQNFFKALLNSLNGAGFQTAEDVFGKVERGELRGTKETDKINKIDERKSLKAGFRVPLSTVDLMESDALVSRKELNLKVEKEADERAGQLNNVREIAVSLNNQTLSQFGKMDRNNLTEENAVKISEAMADEVLYQLGTTSTTGTGLGWYSNNYPNAVKRLSTKFLELKTNRHAQAVFTALVAITSNGERVKKNISNAINFYSKLRMGKPLVAMGNRRPTALQNNLKTLQDLLIEHGENFEQHLLKETTVADMNVQLRARGEKPDASYLAETTVPTAAIYFGPKLGAFYANLSGSEGYLTMDLWWTRTVNRMRGLLIPMATTASIGKFRSMMERPNLTRDEIVSAAIPFRDKYLEYGYNTDLEHLTKSKEPAKKFLKAAWFKRAEKVAGDSYDQLLYEHNLEKMANTIYKNEYEMLAEAPFTASDRKFMYDVGRKTQSLLRNQGVSLTLADIQAALWYYEKRLYQKLSGRKADDIGYEEAIIAQANEGTGRARPSVVFIGGVDGGSVATGEIESSEGLREEPTAEESKVEGTNENISPREPTVRPSDRSGEGRSAANGTKLSLREDIRSYRGRDEAVPETHTERSIGDGRRIRVLGVKPIAEFTPTDLFKKIVNEYGHQSPVFYEISGKDAAVYEQAIQDSKVDKRYGAAVYVYPVEEYANMRLFMTEDGKSGVALKGDDIVSVFSGLPHKGSVNSSIQLAVQEGGRRLDAFDTVLTGMYHSNGFQVVGRMKWNEDYKPDNWDKKTFSSFNNGEPDVVYMAYNPDDNRTVFENPGEYFDDPDELSQAQRDAVNTYFNEGTGYGSAQQTETARRLKAQTGTVSGQRGVRRGLQLLDDETRAKYPNLEEPVKGLPATVKVDGVDVTFGPYIAAREAAILHAEASGIPYQQQASYHKLDPEFSKILASSYARMLDEPNSYQVKAAYKAWADETIAQYKAMLKTGITVEFFPNSIDTYGNPRKSILDVLNNNHLYVFPADGGFGKEAITNEQIKNNPALALTDIIISGRRARVVEVFRATHDFFGHIKEGFGFRAEGEENAFQSHVRMYSPLAARAMTAGTRGQNSEVNFGPNAAFNKTASGKDTKYADQKIGLMPEWATTENIEPNVKYSLGKGVVLGTKQEGSISFSGTHYGKIKTDNLNASKYGTGLQGSESRRLSGYWDDRIKKRVYFYVPKYDGTMPLPESGVGGYVYTQKFDNIASPAVMSKLYAKARGDANTMETLVVEAGYDGYAAPSMGMMVILNHDVPVNYEGTKAEFDANKPKLSLKNAAFHSGDLGYGKDTVLGRMSSRSTGHFGTGTYFTSTEPEESRFNPRADRPNHIVSLDGYKLARPRTKANAEALHKGLKQVNDLSSYLNGVEEINGENRKRVDKLSDDAAFNVWLSILPNQEISEIKQMALKAAIAATKEYDSVAFKNTYAETASTRLMRALGYDGVDVRHLPDYDNTNYGTVVYGKTFKERAPQEKLSLRAAPNTPEFKRWFGDSKVVDENGEPMVMYHGTARDITEFRPKQANAIFLTKNPKFANDFSTRSKEFIQKEFWNNLNLDEQTKLLSNVLENTKLNPGAYKSLKDDINSGYGYTFSTIPFVLEEGALNAIDVKLSTNENIMPVYVSAKNPFDYKNAEHVDKVLKAVFPTLDMKDSSAENNLNSGNWSTIESEEYQDAIKYLGFDSFYVKESGQRNLAVYKSSQIKSAIGNTGAYDANNPDIRYSLRKFKSEDLPKEQRKYNLPANTLIFHGSHGSAAAKIEESGRVLLTYPGIKSSGGTPEEGGLIFFGSADTADNFAQSLADPFAVESARDRGEIRSAGTVFQTVTDRSYKLMDRYQKLTAAEANALNEALGIPDYKYLRKGDNANRAASLADSTSKFTSGKVKRTIIKRGEYDLVMSSPWPVIFKTLEVDGFYDNRNVPSIALTSDNGIRLVGKDNRLEKFSLTQKVNSLPNSSKILDSVNKIISVQEQTGHVERMVAAFSPKSRSNFRAAFIDRYNQIGVNSKQVAKLMGENWLLADVSAEAAANMSDLATGVSASALGVGQGKGGIPVYANGFTKVFNDDGKIKGAVEIFSTLAKYNNPEIYRMYQWWAGSLRGKRLLDEGREYSYTRDDIKLAEELLVSFPEFEQVQKEWIVYNDGLVKYAVDTGVLTKEAGEKFREYGDYIPFYRQIDGEQTVGPNIFSGISGVKGPKTLKGNEKSEAPLANFLETIVRNTQSIIESGMKNVAAERAVRDAVILGQAEKLNFQPKEFKSDVVSYQEKGKTVYYKLADPALYEAMKGLNIPDMPWLGILSAPANLLRTLVTKDPGFMLVNLMRDSVSAWVTSGSSMTPIVDTMNQFVKTLAGKSPEAQALMMSGVLGGYDFASNVESGGKDLAKYLRKKTNTKTTTEFLATPFTSIWEALEKGTTASDAATRAAIYRRVMDETGNEAEAIYRALEVLNFNRKGNAAVVRILTAIVPFLNARIQGLDVLYRASFGEMASKDAKAIQKAFLIRGLFLMGMTALYYAATADDEEYQKQEQEVRDNNWLIPSLGIKIPIPFEIGVLFKVIPERIMAYHYGTDTGKDLLESAARNIVSTFAFNPVPQAIIPFVETATNYSFFTGREIVPRELKDVSPEFQTNAGTSGLAKRISSGLADILPSGLKEKALSPIQIDHIVNGYTGTLGMYASSMLNSVFDRSTDPTRADLRLEQMPVLRRILIDKAARGNATAYYDLKHSTDTMVRTINLLEKTQNFEELGKYQQENLNLLATQDYMKDLAKMMKELNEYSVMIKSSQMDGASKRDALLAINQAQNNVTANIKTIRKMLN